MPIMPGSQNDPLAKNGFGNKPARVNRGAHMDGFDRTAVFFPTTPAAPHNTFTPTLTYVLEGGEWNYYADFVVSAGEHITPGIPMLNRIWANDELIYDAEEGTQMEKLKVTFFDGNEDQGPVYRNMHYRGLMTLYFEQMPLKAFGDNIPRIEVELIEIEEE